MLSIYDPEMFCFLIVTVFCDMAHNHDFKIISNCDLIQLTVSTIDPACLQELICLTMIGSAKIFDRDEPMPVIGK